MCLGIGVCLRRLSPPATRLAHTTRVETVVNGSDQARPSEQAAEREADVPYRNESPLGEVMV